jgi:hypothetical protein
VGHGWRTCNQRNKKKHSFHLHSSKVFHRLQRTQSFFLIFLKKIVEVNLTAQNPVLIKTDSSLTFTYSVQWVKSETTFEHRFHKYLDDNFFEHKIHWFSIFNSFMMVIFLAGLVFIILVRTLKTELAKIAKEAEQAFESGDELPGELNLF